MCKGRVNNSNAPILLPKSSKPSSPTSAVAADTLTCLYQFQFIEGLRVEYVTPSKY